MLNKTMNKAACILSDIGIDPLNNYDIKEVRDATVLKLLLEGKSSSKILYKNFRFLLRKHNAINKHIGDDKWINICKKYNLKKKPVMEKSDCSILTDFFSRDPMLFSVEDGKIKEEVLGYGKQKTSMASEKKYKNRKKHKVTYIFDKEYYKSIKKKELDLNKAVAYYEDYHNAWDNKYVYFIHLNEEAGANQAVADAIKREITLIICYTIIMTLIIQNAINSAHR